MHQNDEVLYLVRQCRRAKTIQILTGHNLKSFIETMELVRNRPRGDVKLCHIAPVKGENSTGLFHCRNLFYGGTYQNRRFGKKYISGGLSILNKHLLSKWDVDDDTSTNHILLKIEEFLGNIVQDYLEVSPVRKSKRYQAIKSIIEIDHSKDVDDLITLPYQDLIAYRDNLRKKASFKIEYGHESKFLAYMDGLTRFIAYGGERKSMLRKLRKLLVISYMALERAKVSNTYNKYFYVHYEPLMNKKYAYAKLINEETWSSFKDLTYNVVFSVLQGASPNINQFRKQMMSYLEFPEKPYERKA